MIPSLPVAAAGAVSTKIHIYTGSWDDKTITINYQTAGDYLKLSAPEAKILL